MNDTNTESPYQQISHSELFSSPKKFKEFLEPNQVGDKDNPVFQYSTFSVPTWHPFYKGMGLIQGIEVGEKIKIIFGFNVNLNLPLQRSLENKWIRNEILEEPFETVKAYFVNGSSFGTKDGPFVIINGPKEFSFTFKEQDSVCEVCGQKE